MEEIMNKRRAAEKRVREIKSFYSHLVGYIVINLLIILLRIEIVVFLSDWNKDLDPSIYDWIDLNVLLTPLLWGIGLLIHGIYIFRYKFTFLKNWEERQIRKYMEEEETRLNKFN